MREKWTDERLDDMKEQMQIGFDRVDAELRELRAEMGANHRLQVQLSIGTIGTVVLSFLGLLLSHA